MPVNDELGMRMKTHYEEIPKIKLMRRTPVIIRIDGKAFHTFTRGFQKPFDEVLTKAMQETTKYLCENIQGCVFGYTQSDEISLVLVDYKKLNSSAWFDYEIQKMCSVAASMATMAFNKFFAKNIKEYDMEWKCSLTPQSVEIQEAHYNYIEALNKAIEKGAMFDARCFNIPREEVTNCIYWRQLDATRNSIQMVGQANFSHAELQGKTGHMIQDMLMAEKGINWNDFPAYLKRGTAVIKEVYLAEDGEALRAHWKIDLDMPQLKGDDRWYLERLIKYE